MSARLRLDVQVAVRPDRIPTERQFRRWARAALGCSCAVTLRVVGTAEGRRLNRGFRERDYATNVLTFVYGGERVLHGDIALCAPVVLREAREQRKDPEAHWAHLVVHGMLHLQGWDHEIEAEAAEMEALETQIVTELGYPDPYLVAA